MKEMTLDELLALAEHDDLEVLDVELHHGATPAQDTVRTFRARPRLHPGG